MPHVRGVLSALDARAVFTFVRRLDATPFQKHDSIPSGFAEAVTAIGGDLTTAPSK